MKGCVYAILILSLLLCFCAEEGEQIQGIDTTSKDILDLKDTKTEDFYSEDMQVIDYFESPDIADTNSDVELLPELITDIAQEDTEITDTETTDIQTKDIDITDIQMADTQIADNLAIDIHFTDIEITDMETADVQMTDTQTSDTSSSDFIIPPIKSCQNLNNPCQAVQTETKIFATYRKDYYLNDSDYNEYTDYPIDGGRFHIAMVSNVTGKITAIYINGENVENMLIKPKMEWYHYWPEKVKAGGIVWFAFHSRDKKWDSATSATIKIETDNGVAVDGTFEAKKTKVPLTYITTSDDMTEFLVYLQNTDSVNHTIKSIKLNAKEVLLSSIACVPDKIIKPQETSLIRIPLCNPAKAGEPYTVVVEFENTNPSVGVGRVIKPFFPIEAWPNSSECPVPGGNQKNYQAARNAFIDTIFVYVVTK